MLRPTAVLPLLVVLVATACGPGAPAGAGSSRERIDLSGPGWTVWIDAQAEWEADVPRLLEQPADVAGLPVNPPSGGWEGLPARGVPAMVPGTVEGLLWPERGDVRGVSWWSREIVMPASAAGRRARLCFDAVRLRAEVFLDGRLVGYDSVGNTPFSVELGDAARPGHSQRLDVRITDPGGNFDWIDHTAQHWGDQTIPASHGFGGLTGAVRLELVDPLHVADVFVRNTADPRTIELAVQVDGPDPAAHPLRVQVLEADSGRLVHEQALGTLADDAHELRAVVQVPDARLWSPDDPRLYVARVRLGDDALDTRFGFRWFAPEGQGEDAVFRLNGRRVVLRSAISWGYWPVDGLVPTPELARRQVLAAKALGLNMLNHHRTIAHPLALDASDELGLLAHLEPGGWWAQQGDELARAFARAKWLRMVTANRSRPSVVILELGNEIDEPPGERALADLAAAHRLDPSRTLTYTSAWADTDPPGFSLHVRPRPSGWPDPDDDLAGAFHTDGWHDQHEAPGPGAWRDGFYQGPGRFALDSDRVDEILMRGEQAAVPGPPRLALMPDAFDAAGRDGWDGAAYREQAAGWLADATRMGLIQAYGSLDALTRSAGAVAHDHHARLIALARATDVLDGYVINGWESERLENHSGIVDVWRRPKADPSPLAAANAPALVVVAARRHVLHGARERGAGVRAPAVAELDLYAVNELDLRGEHRLRLTAEDGRGRVLASREWTVDLLGGETYGQLLREGERLQLDLDEGRVTLRAELLRGDRAPDGDPDEVLAVGRDELWLVDWMSVALPSGGARVGSAPVLDRFLSQAKGLVLPPFDPEGEAPAWVLVAGVDPEPRSSPDAGLFPGTGVLTLRAGGHEWSVDAPFVAERILPRQTLPAPAPDDLPATEVWEQRWSGTLLPAESGAHRVHVTATLGARLSIGGERLLDEWVDRGPRRMVSRAIELVAGRAVPFELELLQEADAASYRVEFTPPSIGAPARATAAALVRQASEEGTTVIVLDHAAGWARLFSERGALELRGEFPLGRYWMGGGFLPRPHPALAGLPSDRALGWEFQELVRSDRDLRGLLLGGEVDTVVACWSDHQSRLGSALAVVPCGRGRIVLNTLDLVTALDAPGSAVAVPRRLLCNLLRLAGGAD